MVKGESAKETVGWCVVFFDGNTKKLNERVDTVASCYKNNIEVKNRN